MLMVLSIITFRLATQYCGFNQLIRDYLFNFGRQTELAVLVSVEIFQPWFDAVVQNLGMRNSSLAYFLREFLTKMDVKDY